MSIPKENKYGWKRKLVRRQSQFFDGHTVTSELIFDPTEADLNRRIEFLKLNYKL
jgi:hypothetical protein